MLRNNFRSKNYKIQDLKLEIESSQKCQNTMSDPSTDIGKHNIEGVRYKYEFIEDKIKNNESPDIIVINTDKKTQKQVQTEVIKELKKRGIK